MCRWTFQTLYQSLHQRTGNQACSHSSLHQPHYTPLTCASANCSQTTQWLTFSVAPCCFTCLETYLRPTAPGLKTAKGQQHKEKTRPGIATEQRLWQRRTLMPRPTTVTQPHNHSCGQHALTPEWLTNLTSRRGHTHTHTAADRTATTCGWLIHLFVLSASVWGRRWRDLLMHRCHLRV